MAATRREESENDARSAAVMREIRQVVADQLYDLVIERQSVGSSAEVKDALERVQTVARQIVEARGRQQQARELGMPMERYADQERDARALLRQSVMSLGAAVASWVVKLDVDQRRQEMEPRPPKNSGRRRDEDTI